jgi:AcrR family transcriptional regulator
MPSARTRRSEDRTVIERLVSAADAALRTNSVEEVTIDAVAAAAGVSRATAFRHLGKRDDMLVAVALKRGAGYARECTDQMALHTGTFAQLEAAFLYLARTIPTDTVITELMSVRTAADLDTDLHDVSTAILGPALKRGQTAGDVRSDVPVTDLVTWTVEQVYLTMQQLDQTDRAISDRVHRFVVPALAPQARDVLVQLDQIATLSTALASAQQALTVLRNGVPSAPTRA